MEAKCFRQGSVDTAVLIFGSAYRSKPNLRFWESKQFGRTFRRHSLDLEVAYVPLKSDSALRHTSDRAGGARAAAADAVARRLV